MFLISSAKDKLFTTLSRNIAEGELLKDKSVCFANATEWNVLQWTHAKLQAYYEITLHYTGVYSAYSKLWKKVKKPYDLLKMDV